MTAAALPVTVFCVDDQACFRDALRELVAATPGFVHVGEAASGADAIVAMASSRPNVVLMDVWMPGLSGLETARLLLRERRDLVVILTSADAIVFPPEYRQLRPRLTAVRKQDLYPRMLLDAWHGRSNRSAPE